MRPGLRSTATSWDSQRPAARFQPLLFTVAGLALLPAAAATLMRVVPPSDDATALLAAFVPYGLLGYLIALVCLLIALLRARHRLVPAVITAAVVVLTAYHLGWLAPFFLDDHRTAAAGQFKLLSLNMHNGAADSADVAEQAARRHVVSAVGDDRAHSPDRRHPTDRCPSVQPVLWRRALERRAPGVTTCGDRQPGSSASRGRRFQCRQRSWTHAGVATRRTEECDRCRRSRLASDLSSQPADPAIASHRPRPDQRRPDSDFSDQLRGLRQRPPRPAGHHCGLRQEGRTTLRQTVPATLPHHDADHLGDVAAAQVAYHRFVSQCNRA